MILLLVLLVPWFYISLTIFIHNLVGVPVSADLISNQVRMTVAVDVVLIVLVILALVRRR